MTSSASEAVNTFSLFPSLVETLIDVYTQLGAEAEGQTGNQAQHRGRIGPQKKGLPFFFSLSFLSSKLSFASVLLTRIVKTVLYV